MYTSTNYTIKTKSTKMGSQKYKIGILNASTHYTHDNFYKLFIVNR